jgi:hypothetical protein
MLRRTVDSAHKNTALGSVYGRVYHWYSRNKAGRERGLLKYIESAGERFMHSPHTKTTLVFSPGFAAAICYADMSKLSPLDDAHGLARTFREASWSRRGMSL